ncbi:hypothetical protein LR48_Vigan03g002900 [Vigna angularis]|uniref:Calcium/calmodulin-regulated receptor-like kinase n=2 Tax=Phaseolus angularis TaxID=3914 RepID=A0A0L9U1E5_PHAAN|nr:calcium/calmodulin-regulated receptor-like kinase 2 [Vigna angularis]XP_017419552.1 calcium/calmodulin-regulated receptor-like kinase 2 [Vigna angularis]KAG2403947.1 Calcium/calmodulin-regulated receptor-like kinase [Vigna angularis]KOM36648.1 hypothetical protein LR48_Vigan03g002900 [Vigna angularis]BAT83196.1 hypothetical protein VIGAN_04031200 [Vigna angularis var. angularis]
MVDQGDLVVICVSIGVALGILIACLVYFCTRWYNKRTHLSRSANEPSLTAIPIRTNGLGTSTDFSASLTSSIATYRSPNPPKKSHPAGRNHQNKDGFASVSGILKYSYKEIQKATQNFTSILGEGSFGTVYKAVMPTGEVVAVKMLAPNSKQGEKEFLTEVLLLGRLHHRNLVNLLGYCVDKGQLMLVYEFMSNGSLENLLYDEEKELSWDERLQIAVDISHGIEYLHEGAVPHVVHRDLKSANILLDHSMRAKVSDFGLSKEEIFDGRNSGLKGTYGYMDPAYITSSKFTVKSDIYSFGIIIFELITAIHPHQNLMEYINLAAMDYDGVDGILDKQLVGKCSVEEVRQLAKIAHKCLHKSPRKRPSISEVSQAILGIRQRQRRLMKEDTMSFASTNFSRSMSQIDEQQVELSTGK